MSSTSIVTLPLRVIFLKREPPALTWLTLLVFESVKVDKFEFASPILSDALGMRFEASVKSSDSRFVSL